MQLLYGNEYFEIENNVSSINMIFDKINKSLEQKDAIFSHLIIDDVEVYENHETYIKELLHGIEKIEVVIKSKKEIIWETMESIYEYLGRAVPALTELVDESYENFSSKSWKGINQLAEGMQWILQFASIAKSASQQPANWKRVESSLQECEKGFAVLLKAVEAQDTVLITDILSYEVTPAYESLKEQLRRSLDDKEFLKHVN